MKLFLESSLAAKFDIVFLCTNVRRTNRNKGRLGPAMVWAFFRFFSQLIWMLLRYRPKLVYYPVTATQVGWVGRDVWCLLLCRLFATQTVIHLRAAHFRLNYEQFHPVVRRLVKWACDQVSVGIVQADYLHDQFRGLIPPDRMETLYQAIDSNQYENPHLDDYQPGKVIFLGHLTQAKGYCDLLKAVPLVVKVIPHVKFFVAGTLRRGERNVLYNQLTAQRLRYEDPVVAEQSLLDSQYASNYENLGVISGEQKLELLRSADLLVLPSYSEGFSRAVVEAMCVGKPVVFTPVGAHREVLQQRRDGLSVEPGDAEGLAQAILQLLSDRGLRAAIAEHNYRRVREEFDVEIIAEKLAAIFRRLLVGNVDLVTQQLPVGQA